LRFDNEPYINELISYISINIFVITKKLECEYNILKANFDSAVKEANDIQRQVEDQIQIQESNIKENGVSSRKEKSGQFENACEENEELCYEDVASDALMINESTNEFGEERQDGHFPQIEALMQNDQLMIDTLLNELNSGKITKQYLTLVKCMPNFSGMCFGHFSRKIMTNTQSISTSSLCSHIDQMDHTQISINSKSNDNCVFKLNQKCFVTIPCAITDDFFTHFSADMLDPNKNKVMLQIKEKMTADERIVRIYFEPTVQGFHTLTVKYRGLDIINSPFSFIVISNNLIPTMSLSNSFTTINGSFVNESQKEQQKPGNYNAEKRSQNLV
jgi:hypothetical protein